MTTLMNKWATSPKLHIRIICPKQKSPENKGNLQATKNFKTRLLKIQDTAIYIYGMKKISTHHLFIRSYQFKPLPEATSDNEKILVIMQMRSEFSL